MGCHRERWCQRNAPEAQHNLAQRFSAGYGCKRERSPGGTTRVTHLFQQPRSGYLQHERPRRRYFRSLAAQALGLYGRNCEEAGLPGCRNRRHARSRSCAAFAAGDYAPGEGSAISERKLLEVASRKRRELLVARGVWCVQCERVTNRWGNFVYQEPEGASREAKF